MLSLVYGLVVMKMCISSGENACCSVSGDAVSQIQWLSRIAFPRFQVFCKFINLKCEDFSNYLMGF